MVKALRKVDIRLLPGREHSFGPIEPPFRSCWRAPLLVGCGRLRHEAAHCPRLFHQVAIARRQHRLTGSKPPR
jgi:hypothetical protein